MPNKLHKLLNTVGTSWREKQMQEVLFVFMFTHFLQFTGRAIVISNHNVLVDNEMSFLFGVFLSCLTVL